MVGNVGGCWRGAVECKSARQPPSGFKETHVPRTVSALLYQATMERESRANNDHLSFVDLLYIFYQRAPTLMRLLTDEQYLNSPTGILYAFESRGDYFAIVENKNIAANKVVKNGKKMPVLYCVFSRMYNHEP